MKSSIALKFLFCILPSALTAQTARDILQMAHAKCQLVQNGYIETTRFMKSMTKKDTLSTSFHFRFKKTEKDTVFSSVFYAKEYFNNKYSGDRLHTGNEIVTMNPIDSNAVYISRKLGREAIMAYKFMLFLYPPLTTLKSFPVPAPGEFDRPEYKFIYEGEEFVKDYDCYHVSNFETEKETNDPMQPLSVEYHFWINKKDSVPVRYSLTFTSVMGNDTMIQYQDHILDKYELNNLKDTVFSVDDVPAWYRLTDWAPPNFKPTLPADTIAPDWKLSSLTGEAMQLSKLKGELVLIDFFYKSCFPCMKALPVLQSLHEKYNGKGLHVIGVDPIDKNRDDLKTFLQKRGITYNVLTDAEEAAINYRVSAYPTLFLIDKKGKIVFVHSGFSETMKEDLEKMIERYL